MLSYSKSLSVALLLLLQIFLKTFCSWQVLFLFNFINVSDPVKRATATVSMFLYRKHIFRKWIVILTCQSNVCQMFKCLLSNIER